ncbi:hypothetical protein VTL71DRAFT_8467 [Oculimacula yallundae]|uniref:Uncharacterized protein n=1 Tax=Oculimacula yallundae TaxID=86028 RepID=A0ABR4CXP6_9HELO
MSTSSLSSEASSHSTALSFPLCFPARPVHISATHHIYTCTPYIIRDQHTNFSSNPCPYSIQFYTYTLLPRFGDAGWHIGGSRILKGTISLSHTHAIYPKIHSHRSRETSIRFRRTLLSLQFTILQFLHFDFSLLFDDTALPSIGLARFPILHDTLLIARLFTFVFLFYLLKVEA